MFKELIKYYISMFQRDGQQALVTLCNCKVPSDILLIEYKKLSPIEDMSEKEKQDYWEYAKEIYPAGDTETRLKLIKITYVIGTLL